MARLPDTAAPSAQFISDGWRLTETAPNACAAPADLSSDIEWLPAFAPGTVAHALRALGKFDPNDPRPLEDSDFWYRATIEGRTREIFSFDGLATIADVFLDNVKIVDSRSMFVSHEIEVDLAGRHELAICFRALGPLLAQTGKRARWRPKMVTPATLRAFRTTFFGHMPGWCPPVHAIGPWRPIRRRSASERIRKIDLHSSLDGADGFLDIRIKANIDSKSEIECFGVRAPLMRADDGALTARLVIPNVRPWMPHTHGEPVLHDIHLIADGARTKIARTGFRRIEIDRDQDGKGFGLRINGERIFCRGAVWTTPDVTALPSSREAYEPWLKLARDANMNMLRVGGTMVYEADVFYELCDELGILIWQDFILANFDYPAADQNFVDLIDTEARQFLDRTQTSPSIAILCGGSEIAQQASMLGLPKPMWSNRIFDEILPAAARDLRPDAFYLPNAPYGGPLPFEPAEGVCHYYGVSAYMRPVEDARHANVRFAAESLGHAHVPDYAKIELEADAPKIVHREFAERLPNDVGATWFFEDVRNHYMRELYGADPAALRRDNPQRFLDLSRATTAELIESVYALWRRQGSPTRGGLVWFFQDLMEGAGWGVIDSLKQPKAAWHALRRAFRPLQVLLIDEGLNGLHVDLINEAASEFSGSLSLVCLRDGATPVMRAERAVTLSSRSTTRIAAVELWGAFFDTAYAYRFGPPSHDATVATLKSTDEAHIGDAFHFPLGRDCEQHDIDISCHLAREDDDWTLTVATNRLAQSLHVFDAHYRSNDNWFHLPPDTPRKLMLVPRFPEKPAPPPSGIVSAINAKARISFGPPP